MKQQVPLRNNRKQREEIYFRAIDAYGVKAQMQIAVEEMSELTKEICKQFRNIGNRENIAEEIADVTIMLEQLKLIFGVDNEVCEAIDKKIDRLAARLEIKSK